MARPALVLTIEDIYDQFADLSYGKMIRTFGILEKYDIKAGRLKLSSHGKYLSVDTELLGVFEYELGNVYEFYGEVCSMDVPASAKDLKFKATILRKAKGFKLEMFSEAVLQGQVEHQQVISLCQELCQIHENYSGSIKNLRNRSGISKLDASGFGKDDESNLKQAFGLTLSECEKYGQELLLFSSILRDTSESMKVWLEESRQLFRSKQLDFDGKSKQLTRLKLESERKRSLYDNSCKNYDQLKRELDAANSDVPAADKLEILLTQGSLSVSLTEFRNIVKKMQSSILAKEIKYPLLGTYKVINGLDISDYMKSNHGNLIKNDDDSTAFGEIMVERDVIRLVGRFNKFVPKDNWFYQWNKSEDEVLAEKIAAADTERNSAREAYKTSVEEAEKFRESYELFVTEHLNFVQNMELSRIGSEKQAMITVSTALNGLGLSLQRVSSTIQVGLETVVPEKEIDSLVERFRSGMIRPPTIMFKDYYVKVASTSLFGVSVEDHYKFFGVTVPWIVRNICTCLTNKAKVEDVGYMFSLFMQSLDVSPSETIKVKKLLDSPEEIGVPDLISSYSLPVLLAVLRRYLMELPVPLLLFDDYEAFKTLYLSKSGDADDNKRTDSVRELILNLPIPHFHTLKYLVHCFNKILISDEDKDDSISEQTAQLGTIFNFWGDLFLRPKQLDLNAASPDRHASRLMKDLVCSFNEIFLNGTLKPASSETDIISPGNDSEAAPEIERRESALDEVLKSFDPDDEPPKPEIQQEQEGEEEDEETREEFDNIQLDSALTGEKPGNDNDSVYS